jgi:sugar phosphate isomerase/epimerase
MGKASPVEYFKKYPGRFKLLHIKDHKEIGQSGMVGFDAIFKNAELAGVEHIVVEAEAYESADMMDGVRLCANYLLNADFVKAAYTK